MNVLIISRCTKRAREQSCQIIDQFAERTGDAAWQTTITMEGVDTLRKLLRKTARRNTAVACHWLKKNGQTELLWIVGNLRRFNAAALDVAKLMQTRTADGDSLLASLKRGDHAALSAFTDDENQVREWVAGFSRAFAPGKPASHKLAKQGYFPVGDSYHLLSPLFATSLVHAAHQKMVALRFGEEMKNIWKARREKYWHPGTLTLFPDSAETHFGGTKPQNISYLNSVRGGRVWLLSCQPPQWKKAEKPPTTLRSIFTSGGQFDRRANSTVQLLVSLLTRTGDYTNVRIREARDEYIDALIDLLFVVASELQRDTWQNWTISCPRLASHQQLWLDPWRTKNDEVFRLERDKDDWQAGVAEDFALWLNTRLRKGLKDIGKVEEREWQTREHLRTNLREMEKIIQGALK